MLCHECGRWYVALGVHVGMVHDGARAYRLAHGLPLHVSLSATELREHRAQRAREVQLVRQVQDVRSPTTLHADQELIERGIRLSRARQAAPADGT